MSIGGIEIDRKISLGNLIAIGAVVVGIIVGWSNLDSRVSATERETLAVKAGSLERDARQDAAITDLTRSSNSMALLLEGIRVDVGYLRRNVEEAKRVSVP